MAKRTSDQPPIVDSKGTVIWDGKARWLTLTIGGGEVINYMFSAMQKYVNKLEWNIKIEKSS